MCIRDSESAVESTGVPIKRLISGAGHDAMILSKVAPAGMLFVRCRDGVSHHPDEFVAADDVRVALQVVIQTIVFASHVSG